MNWHWQSGSITPNQAKQAQARAWRGPVSSRVACTPDLRPRRGPVPSRRPPTWGHILKCLYAHVMPLLLYYCNRETVCQNEYHQHVKDFQDSNARVRVGVVQRASVSSQLPHHSLSHSEMNEEIAESMDINIISKLSVVRTQRSNGGVRTWPLTLFFLTLTADAEARRPFRNSNPNPSFETLIFPVYRAQLPLRMGPIDYSFSV